MLTAVLENLDNFSVEIGRAQREKGRDAATPPGMRVRVAYSACCAQTAKTAQREQSSVWLQPTGCCRKTVAQSTETAVSGLVGRRWKTTDSAPSPRSNRSRPASDGDRSVFSVDAEHAKSLNTPKKGPVPSEKQDDCHCRVHGRHRCDLGWVLDGRRARRRLDPPLGNRHDRRGGAGGLDRDVAQEGPHRPARGHACRCVKGSPTTSGLRRPVQGALRAVSGGPPRRAAGAGVARVAARTRARSSTSIPRIAKQPSRDGVHLRGAVADDRRDGEARAACRHCWTRRSR